jgi:hypothetical protein
MATSLVGIAETYMRFGEFGSKADSLLERLYCLIWFTILQIAQAKLVT